MQDTNGDACIVEAVAGGGRRRAVRGWAAIDAVLELKQRLLAWRVLQQLLGAQARQPQHAADADGAVAAVQRMAAAALADCQAALDRQVATGGAGDSGAAAMDLDGPASGSGAPQAPATQQPAAPAALPASMLSSAALDIRAALELPGFQQQFEGWALQRLADLLPGGSQCSTCAADPRPAPDVLGAALSWLRHAALRHRLAASLQRWCGRGGGRAARPVDSGEEGAVVWQLEGGSLAGAAPPALIILHGDSVRAEGAAAAGLPPASAQRGLLRAELDRLLQSL